MIRRLKEFLKRHWPALRLRTILFATLLFVAALPGFGAVFLRVYENSLVQQTEAELIAQGTVLAAAYRASWPAPLSDDPGFAEPLRPAMDLNALPILPEQPRAALASGPAPSAARAAASKLLPVVRETARSSLASIRILDGDGIVLIGSGDAGRSYAHLPELRSALGGEAATVLRRSGTPQPFGLEMLSRTSGARVHHVRPVRAGERVIGVVMVSGEPRNLFLGIYQDRGKIALGVTLIFLTLLLLAGLLSRGITRPIEALSEATRNVARGQVAVPEPPPTAAVEIRSLYLNFAAMAERIERRTRYLKDFAAAVSHELKTPIAGLKGALELLTEHPEMSEEQRRRFLANASADADRLSHLLQRLLDVARADMTVAPQDSAAALDAPVRSVADAHRGPGFSVEVALPELPQVAAPAELIEAVVETLVENSRQSGAGTVRIEAAAEGGRVRLCVSDDGPGVPPADHERIFEPFHTSRRAEGGSGLGLSIARSLLTACGGTIESVRVDRGARFEILVPTAT